MTYLLPEPKHDTYAALKLLAGSAFLILASCTLSAYFVSASGSVPKVSKAGEEINVKPVANPFDSIHIDARSAYVWDVSEKKVLFALHENDQMPLASLTKIMMAVTARELIPEYTVIKINKEFLVADGDSGLLADENWKLTDLLDMSLTASSNDGAYAIASVAGAIHASTNAFDIGRQQFVNEMNRISKEVGLTHTYFMNETGLDNSNLSASGAYGTSKDVATLLEYAIKKYPNLFEATRFDHLSITSLNNIHHLVLNTNPRVSEIPGIIASKTGYTDLAGGNVAVAFNAGLNRPVVVVLLGSTYDGRFSDLTTLVGAAVEYVSLQKTK